MVDNIVIVLGTGEVGRPLLEILSTNYETKGVDVERVDVDRPCSALHICYPFQIRDFVGTTVEYIEQYKPGVAIVNSTVAIGTTRKIADRTDVPVIYSPVRGKHAKMVPDMRKYKKFVGGFDEASTKQAAAHFVGAGLDVGYFPNPEIGELSKLLETTWLGVLIGWAQEAERMAEKCGGAYKDVNAFIEEIDFLPSHIFPGRIGGHCVMPNIAILREHFTSALLDAVVASNEQKEKEASDLVGRTVSTTEKPSA